MKQQKERRDYKMFIINKKILPIVTGLIIGIHTVFAGESITLNTLEWEPYIGQKLKNQGYVAEVVKEAFKRSGYDLEIKFRPWKRAVMESQKGTVDGYFPEYYSEEVTTHAIFSEPFPGGPVGFFAVKGTTIIYDGNLETLKPYKIGVVRGYVNSEKFDAATFLRKEEVVDDITNIKKLIMGRIALCVADKFVGLYLYEQLEEDMKSKNNIVFLDPPLDLKDLYVCISKTTKKNPESIKNAFNTGLISMKADGTLDKILKSHGF
jgi:polar amino acid transport system substrate-binding protein